MPEPAAAKTAWVRKVLGIDVGFLSATPGGTQADTGRVPGMDAWLSARTAALTSLRALEKAFRGMNEPEVDEAIILLRAVAANLTERPETTRQVNELRRYIGTDDVIDEAEEPNGFGITVSLRQPLLAALDQVRPAG